MKLKADKYVSVGLVCCSLCVCGCFFSSSVLILLQNAADAS